LSLKHSKVLKDFIPWNSPSRTSSVTPVVKFKEVPLLKSKLSFFKLATFLKLFPKKSSPFLEITHLFSLILAEKHHSSFTLQAEGQMFVKISGKDCLIFSKNSHQQSLEDYNTIFNSKN